jgi:cytochrome c-type biogenesis protein CcmH
MKWFILVCLLWTGPALALSPEEMLDDPALEARARVLDFEIRCIRCQSEAVASSNAAWAEDARRVIRERILAGDTNAEVKTFFVERYGEFVLMEPPKSGSTLILWLAAPVMAVIALVAGFGFVRGRSKAHASETGLTEDEAARLKDILKRTE